MRLICCDAFQAVACKNSPTIVPLLQFCSNLGTCRFYRLQRERGSLDKVTHKNINHTEILCGVIFVEHSLSYFCKPGHDSIVHGMIFNGSCVDSFMEI